MRSMRIRSALLAFLLVSLPALFPEAGIAQVVVEMVVYDDTTTRQGPFVDAHSEMGDEIELVLPYDGQWTVTEFELGYLGYFQEDGDEDVIIRFYANDGPGGEPGTLIFQSNPQPTPSPNSFTSPGIVAWLGLSVLVPLTFTWTAEFSGMTGTGGDIASLPSYGPPTVGWSDETYYWSFLSGSWVSSMLFTNNSNFHARVTALPEPSVTAQTAAGLLMLAMMRRAGGRHISRG